MFFQIMNFLCVNDMNLRGDTECQFQLESVLVLLFNTDRQTHQHTLTLKKIPCGYDYGAHYLVPSEP